MTVRRAAVAAAIVLASALGAATRIEAGAVSFSVDAATLQSYLLAATPYDIVVGKKGLSETLTLSSPREVRFEKGAVRLKIDCRGTPIAVEEVLDLTLSVKWNETKKNFEARIETLPVRIPVLGTIDLAEYLRPFAIPSVFSESLAGESTLGIAGKITSLRVLDTMIQVGADITFHRVPPPKAPSATASPAPASSRR